MADAKHLKSAIERNIKALKLRPSKGRGTATTTVKVRSGVTCDIEDGGWKLVADQGPGDGGEDLGPDPGVFGRAALGSCLAMGYAIWASHLDVTLDSVEVVVEADYNAVGMYAIDDSVRPGWGAIRYTVKISSDSPEERVREVIEFADRHSPLLDDFGHPLSITRDLQITAPARK